MFKVIVIIISISLLLQAEIKKPKLILQITVDQLRGDLPFKYMKHMGEGGFRYLMKNGIWYRSAFYEHSVTQTAVGHTTLATGAYPSLHGIVSNSWYDRRSKRNIHNIEDKDTYILKYNGERPIKNKGKSPKNIITSTFTDELALLNNKKSKIFAVSIKDRGAVTLAGHNGKAFWFSKKSGMFVTSSYYYKKYPKWVQKYNKHRRNNEFSNKSWNTILKKSKYMYKDDKKGEVDYAGFGTTFPHKYGNKKDKYFNYLLSFSPVGDELTLDFAKAIVNSQKLGKDEVTDFLSISFSSTDYVGHTFSPSSMEAEDNILRLDKTLANLFEFIDKKVGLENTLIVLSADHGATETPAHLHEHGIESEHLYIEDMDKEMKLFKDVGIDTSLVEAVALPYLYLNYDEITKRGLKLENVSRDIALKLMQIKGVGGAIQSVNLEKNDTLHSLLYASALKNYNKERSGDILIVNKVHYNVNSHKKGVACNHGSPWRYDTFVPIVFAGMNLKAKEVYREVSPRSIAPTLSAIVGAKYPSGTQGIVLSEIMKKLYKSKK